MPGFGTKTQLLTEINVHLKRQLPFIEIKNPPLKLLIDTGANQSFLSPEAVAKYFRHVPMNYEPFAVTNLNCTTSNDHSIEIPSFKEFNQNSKLKFYVYKFHNVFDGLIGFQMLENLKASVDIGKKMLFTPNSKIPIQILNSGIRNLFEALVRAESTKIVKIPVSIENSEFFLPETKLNKCIIPPTVSVSKNGYALVEISNPTRNDIFVCLTSPLTIFPLHPNFEIHNFESVFPKNDEIASLIRTEHLNSEEKHCLLELCKKYTGRFYFCTICYRSPGASNQ